LSWKVALRTSDGDQQFEDKKNEKASMSEPAADARRLRHPRSIGKRLARVETRLEATLSFYKFRESKEEVRQEH
jgi:hypothetical protein